MKSVITINRHVIASNKKNNKLEPAVSCRTGSRKASYGHEVEITGPCKIVYNPLKPLKCGATAYVVTDADVKVINRSVSYVTSDSR